jgi:hypothetical protein
MKSKIILIITAVIVGTAALAASCGGDDDAEAPQNPTPPVVTPTPEPSDPQSRPTGIASVDEAIAAVRDGELRSVIDMLVFQQEACSPAGQGAGAPPECGAGEAPGTLVDVVMFASCEGYWVREHQAQTNLARFVEGDVELYGVFRTDGPAFDGADYVAIFAAERDEGTLAEAVYLTDEGITGADYGCGQSPEQYVRSGGYTGVIVAPE